MGKILKACVPTVHTFFYKKYLHEIRIFNQDLRYRIYSREKGGQEDENNRTVTSKFRQKL